MKDTSKAPLNQTSICSTTNQHNGYTISISVKMDSSLELKTDPRERDVCEGGEKDGAKRENNSQREWTYMRWKDKRCSEGGKRDSGGAGALIGFAVKTEVYFLALRCTPTVEINSMMSLNILTLRPSYRHIPVKSLTPLICSLQGNKAE
jgi:hypothetical protein